MRLQRVAVGRLDEAAQVVAVDLLAEAGAADQAQRQHPLRRQARAVQRHRSPHGVTGQVYLFQVEVVEQGQHAAAEFIEVAAHQGLAGLAVARQV